MPLCCRCKLEKQNSAFAKNQARLARAQPGSSGTCIACNKEPLQPGEASPKRQSKPDHIKSVEAALDPFQIDMASAPHSLPSWLTAVCICLVAVAPMESAQLIGPSDCKLQGALRKLLDFLEEMPPKFLHDTPTEFSGKVGVMNLLAILRWLGSNKDNLLTRLSEGSARVLDFALAPGLFGIAEEYDMPWQLLFMRSFIFCAMKLSLSKAVDYAKLAQQAAPAVIALKLHVARMHMEHAVHLVWQHKQAFTNHMDNAHFDEHVAARACLESFLDDTCAGGQLEFISMYPSSASAVCFSLWELANCQSYVSTVNLMNQGGSLEKKKKKAWQEVYPIASKADKFEACCARSIKGYRHLRLPWLLVLRDTCRLPVCAVRNVRQMVNETSANPDDDDDIDHLKSFTQWLHNNVRSARSEEVVAAKDELMFGMQTRLNRKDKDLQLSEAKSQEWKQKVNSLIKEKGDVRAWEKEEIKRLSAEYLKKEELLQAESADARRSLEEQIVSIEKEFKQREATLQQEHQQTVDLLNEVLASHERFPDAAVQQTQHEREQQALEQQERELKNRELALEHERDSILASFALKEKELKEERAKVDQQKAAFHSRYSAPKHWTRKLTSDPNQNVEVHQVRDRMVLACLRGTLVVDRSDWLGNGRDYLDFSGRPYKSFELVAGWRIENTHLWEKYQVEKINIKRQLESCNLQVPAFQLRPSLVAATSGLPGSLDLSLNEAWLLHGTTPQSAASILDEGMNERFCSRGYFGQGVYLAEDCGKVDQYVKCDPGTLQDALTSKLYLQTQRPRNVYYAFVCRVVLGYTAISQNGDELMDGGAAVYAPAKYNAKKRELAHVEGVDPKIRYHSLVVETTSASQLAQGVQGHRVERYREFVLTHADRIYVEYVIAFRRTR